MVALRPFGHRSCSGDHGQRRPEAEHVGNDGRRRERDEGGVPKDLWLTGSSMEGTAKVEEVGRRRFRPRRRRREADVGGTIRRIGDVPARTARSGGGGG